MYLRGLLKEGSPHGYATDCVYACNTKIYVLRTYFCGKTELHQIFFRLSLFAWLYNQGVEPNLNPNRKPE